MDQRNYARNPVLLSLALACALGACFGEAFAENHLRATAHPTALDRYVGKEDPHFSYKLVNTAKGKDYTGYVLEMTSQQWRTPEEVDQPLWTHWVTIMVPAEIKHTSALMYIGGGKNGGEAPRGAHAMLRKVARATSAIACMIEMIPNQPLKFADSEHKRMEDSIIAYTWDKFVRTGDEEWPLRLPMTKAVVRAMDAVQEFCASEAGGKQAVDSFMVAGGSKRGWTTWTTAAVDDRVIAIAPIVIDILNLLPSFAHHYSVYGRWAPAVNNYVHIGIMDWLYSKEFDALLEIVEPYSYLDRLTMPKLLINACGDQFFLPDSAQFYYKDLQGPYWFRYVPNSGHGVGGNAVDTLIAFFRSVLEDQPMPEYNWSWPDNNTVRVMTKASPKSVKLWQATNPDARDFRIDKVGKAYTATDIEAAEEGVYIGKVVEPEKGWTAYMLELTFPGPGEEDLILTTPVRVTPDVKAFTYEKPASYQGGFLSK